MSPDALRAEARKVLMQPVDDRESTSHILARLWSAGTAAARDLRNRYNREEWQSSIYQNVSRADSEFNLNWATENPELFVQSFKDFQDRYPITDWIHRIDLSLRCYVKLIAIRREQPFASVKDYIESHNGETFLSEIGMRR